MAQESPVLRIHFIRHGQSTNNILSTVSHEYYLNNRLCDPPLTDLGILQALKASKYILTDSFKKTLISNNIDHIYTSAHLRALSTALPISMNLNIKPTVWTDLHEFGGIYKLPNTIPKQIESMPWEPLPEPSVQRSKFLIGSNTDDTWNKNDLFMPCNSETGLTKSQILSTFPAYQFSDDDKNLDLETGWCKFNGVRESKSQFNDRVLRVVDKLRTIAKNLESNKDIICITHGEFLNKILQILFRVGDIKHCIFNSDNAAWTNVDIYFLNNVACTQLKSFNSTEHLDASLISN